MVLRSFLAEPLEVCLLKYLMLKIVLLVTLVSAKRVSELHAKNLIAISSWIKFSLLDVDFLLKVAMDFHITEEMGIPSRCGNPANGEKKVKHN